MCCELVFFHVHHMFKLTFFISARTPRMKDAVPRMATTTAYCTGVTAIFEPEKMLSTTLILLPPHPCKTIPKLKIKVKKLPQFPLAKEYTSTKIISPFFQVNPIFLCTRLVKRMLASYLYRMIATVGSLS